MNRADRKTPARLGGWIAFLAAVALVIQMAAPMGAQAAAVTHLQICSQDGLKTIAIETPADPAGHQDCAKCPVCVTAAAVALPPPAPASLAAPVAAVCAAGFSRSHDLPPARGPPRPRGQGPPSFLDA